RGHARRHGRRRDGRRPGVPHPRRAGHAADAGDGGLDRRHPAAGADGARPGLNRPPVTPGAGAAYARLEDQVATSGGEREYMLTVVVYVVVTFIVAAALFALSVVVF